MWTTDALKSIGMFIPLVSFVLVLRVWRSLDWEMDGSWWGLVILIVTAAVVHIRNQSVLIFVFSPQWSISMPPNSLGRIRLRCGRCFYSSAALVSFARCCFLSFCCGSSIRFRTSSMCLSIFRCSAFQPMSRERSRSPLASR